MGEGNRARRVLVLNHFAAPRGQAGGTRHVELFERLEDWDYLIIASDLNPQSGERVSAERGFAVVSVPPYTSNGFRRVLNWTVYAWRALWLGLRQPDVDAVYGSSPHLLAALSAWAIAAIKGVPFVLEVRDLWPEILVDMGQLAEKSWIYRILTALENFLYARAKAIVVMAEGSRSALLARGVSQRKIYYIPNGADPQDFIPSGSREELRARYGFTRFTAIYAGAHGPANGLGLLLEAAKSLKDCDLELVLVGGGITKPALVEQVRAERIDNVRFIDPVPKSEIPDILAASDLGLHLLADVALFQRAVSPNKLFDYMAAGLPTLTNCPGLVTDLVVQAACGRATTPDPRALATGLRYMCEELPVDELRVMAASGQSWVRDHQSRTAMAKRLLTVLNDVI